MWHYLRRWWNRPRTERLLREQRDVYVEAIMRSNTLDKMGVPPLPFTPIDTTAGWPKCGEDWGYGIGSPVPWPLRWKCDQPKGHSGGHVDSLADLRKACYGAGCRDGREAAERNLIAAGYHRPEDCLDEKDLDDPGAFCGPRRGLSDRIHMDTNGNAV